MQILAQSVCLYIFPLENWKQKFSSGNQNVHCSEAFRWKFCLFFFQWRLELFSPQEKKSHFLTSITEANAFFHGWHPGLAEVKRSFAIYFSGARIVPLCLPVYSSFVKHICFMKQGVSCWHSGKLPVSITGLVFIFIQARSPILQSAEHRLQNAETPLVSLTSDVTDIMTSLVLWALSTLLDQDQSLCKL